MSIFKGTTEPKAIKIGIPHDDYSAMQGPCPSGFHVPLNTEWQTVYNIWTALGGGSSDGTNFGIALKLPFAGRRSSLSASVESQGTYGYYWSSTRSDENRAYYLSFYSTALNPQGGNYRARGFSVRCFKNSPVVPTSSWTKLYGTSIEAGGIFWSSSEGLISLSRNGQTWITIADKNLGATTVWNSGDTLSEANCGKYYQRGNNYGFPRTGGVTTSSVQVNASTYGPGNYYSSSTFITYNGRWDTTDNGNLWGGVTGVVHKADTDIKKVYLGTTKVRPTMDTRTFTISRTEQSNMSSGWTYSDDAAGLTAGSTVFDEFFGYSAVRLNTSGVETAEVTQATPGQLNLSQLGTLTSGDNVMIKFPRLGIKMSKSGSIVTLSITKNPDAEANGFQYYAHSRGTLSSPVKKDALYLGAFKAYNSSNVLKSWSGKSPVVSINQQNSINYARANDGNTGSAGYDIIGFYQREFINALYMMKYGNPNCQSVIGRGYTGGSAKANTGGTVSQTLATYGTTSATQQVKLFGLEDWWGNILEWIGGMCTDGSKNLWTALSGFTGAITTSSPYENTGTTIQHTSGYDLSSIVGNNKGLFAPTATVSNSNYDTYYCDNVSAYVSSLTTAGSYWGGESIAGAFNLDVGRSTSYANMAAGVRLMFL